MGSDAEDNPAVSRAESAVFPASAREAIARELTGSMPCIRCRYDLRGLSVRARCPECATPIRATLLAIVDPCAAELQAIPRPRLLVAGLMTWSAGMLGAALCIWGLRAAGAVYSLTSLALSTPLLAWLAVALLGASALGACALIRPHAGLSARAVLSAAVGAAALAALAAVTWWILVARDSRAPAPYFDIASSAWDREILRLLAGLLMLVAIRGLAANWNTLQARSVLMRTGRTDKQTAPALYAAVLIAMGGDALRLIVRRTLDAGVWEGSLPQLVGTILIAAGSMLLTVGLVGILIDCIKLRPVLLDRPLSLDQLAAPPGGPGRGGSAAT